MEGMGPVAEDATVRHEAACDETTGFVQFAISDGTHHLAGQVSSEDEYKALVTLFAGWRRDVTFPPRQVPSWAENGSGS